MSALGQKADMCIAIRHVRFTPNSDRESGFSETVMFASSSGAPTVAASNTSNMPKVTEIGCLTLRVRLAWRAIVSKKLDAPYRSGKSKTGIKVKNPKAPAATRAQDGTF